MITEFATVTLWVTDFKKAIAFYRDTLGLELISQPGDMPHFKVGNGILVLVKGIHKSPEQDFPPDFPQFSLAVDDLDRTVNQLQSGNITLESNIEERRDARWVILRDPDGNLFELVEVKSRPS